MITVNGHPFPWEKGRSLKAVVSAAMMKEALRGLTGENHIYMQNGKVIEKELLERTATRY